jgi:hypothetical protein
MKHTTKTLKRILKKAGLKRSGSKATLRARAKRAHLVRGGNTDAHTPFAGVGNYPMVSGDAGSGVLRGGRRGRRHRSRGSSSGSDKY